MAKMTTKAALLLLPLLLFFVVAVVSSLPVSASSIAASSRARARKEALLRSPAAESSSQAGIDSATLSRTRKKRAAMARRGGAVVDGDSSPFSSPSLTAENNLGHDRDEFELSDEELLLEQELQRQLDADFFEDVAEEVERTNSAAAAAAASAAAALKPATTAGSSFTSTYGVPPREAAAATAAAATASSAAAAAAFVAPPHAAAATATTAAAKKPLDDIFVVINTPHYLGDGYAAPVDGCVRKVKAAESSPSLPSSVTSSSSSSSTSSFEQHHQRQTIPLRCEFSADTSKAKQAHALWYHLPTTGSIGPYSDLPAEENGGNPFTTRPATEQVAVAATMESAAYYPNILDPNFMRHFAVESSYRLRSGAMLAYFGEPHVQLWTNLSSIKSFKEKKARCVFPLRGTSRRSRHARQRKKTLTKTVTKKTLARSLAPLKPHRPLSATSRPTAAPPREGTASSES